MDYQETRDQLKGQLKDYVEHITQPSKKAGGNMYQCPLCGSGTGAHGTGAFSIKDGTSWKCFSCGEGGDIFDLIGKYENIPNHTEQVKRAMEIYGLAESQPSPFKPVEEYQNQPKTEQETDYTPLFLEANKNITATDYHRGLSLETLNRYRIGYVPAWRHPKAPPQVPTSPRLIIPTSDYSYLARDTRENIPEEQKQYSKSKVGTIHLFNEKALTASTMPIFIVEGELDALSIIDAGGEAIALGTTTKVKSLLETLKNHRPSQPLIIALDNDEAGERAYKELSKGLDGLEIPYYRYNPAGEYKDANEALQKDREAFIKRVTDAKNIEEMQLKERKEAYLRTSTEHYIQGFMDGIADSVNTPYIPTGFNKLDEALDGGLYEGLYILGAISSLGKTTLMIQVADQIAQSGKDVLIFSLEMARSEIMAKSISRHTIQKLLAEGAEDTGNAKTARGITTGKRYEKYSQAEVDLINASISAYHEYAKHIYISEGIGDIGAEEIKAKVKEHIELTGNTPVVVIDYLQILAPYSDRATDKQNTDKSVMELKRISRDYKTPVIGISSFNRANYREAVTMLAFKESGAIEYSSDVLIGLQFKGAGEKDFDSMEAKKKEPREIELVILKNRNGRAGEVVPFKYYSYFNYFAEA